MDSLVNQIDKDTIDCAGITGLRKPGIHCIKVLAPYVIETKVHYYSSSTSRKHVFKTLQVEQTTTPETASNNILSETPPPTANDTVHNKLTSIDAVTAGQWSLVEYEGEFFLGVVLSVSSETASAHIRCLEKPYGVSEPQDLEKE